MNIFKMFNVIIYKKINVIMRAKFCTIFMVFASFEQILHHLNIYRITEIGEYS